MMDESAPHLNLIKHRAGRRRTHPGTTTRRWKKPGKIGGFPVCHIEAAPHVRGRDPGVVVVPGWMRPRRTVPIPNLVRQTPTHWHATFLQDIWQPSDFRNAKEG